MAAQGGEGAAGDDGAIGLEGEDGDLAIGSRVEGVVQGAVRVQPAEDLRVSGPRVVKFPPTNTFPSACKPTQ